MKAIQQQKRQGQKERIRSNHEADYSVDEKIIVCFDYRWCCCCCYCVYDFLYFDLFSLLYISISMQSFHTLVGANEKRQKQFTHTRTFTSDSESIGNKVYIVFIDFVCPLIWCCCLSMPGYQADQRCYSDIKDHTITSFLTYSHTYTQ